MKFLVIAITLVAMVATLAYATPLGSVAVKAIGGGTDNVAHCQVQNHDIAASDTITSINAQVECDLTGSYNVTATVTSGASNGSGQSAASLTADTPLTVAISISPSVTIGSQTHDADIQVIR